jgi:hypothetical protein
MPQCAEALGARAYACDLASAGLNQIESLIRLPILYPVVQQIQPGGPAN